MQLGRTYLVLAGARLSQFIIQFHERLKGTANNHNYIYIYLYIYIYIYIYIYMHVWFGRCYDWSTVEGNSMEDDYQGSSGLLCFELNKDGRVGGRLWKYRIRG